MEKMLNCYSFAYKKDQAYNHIFYITRGEKVKRIEQFSKQPIIASIEFVTSISNDDCIITSICVQPEFRQRGFAYFLFLKTIAYISIIGTKNIYLDDTSDRYRKPNNLYKLLGFKYIEKNGPTMFASIKTLNRSRNLKYFTHHPKWMPAGDILRGISPANPLTPDGYIGGVAI